MTQLKVYNTLSGKKEVFQPINDLVRIYSCGPTVYKYAHIGNLRTYIFMDLLVRVLRYDGYKVKNVMNITDVGHLLSDADEGEDKIMIRPRTQYRPLRNSTRGHRKVFPRHGQSQYRPSYRYAPRYG